MTEAVTVGVTGHRLLGADPRTPWHVQAQCVRLLDRMQELARRRGVGVVAYSGLAIGADQLFAEAAVALGVPLVGVLPCADYADDFTGAERGRFDALRSYCREVQSLPGRRSPEAYLEGGKVLVDQVEFVVAVWNGLPAAGVGGTGDIVAYAREKGRTLFHIDPAALGKPFEELPPERGRPT